MNERIKELAEQAVAAVQNRPNGTCDMNQYNEKLIELFIDECAEVLLKWKNEPFPFDPNFAVLLIKEHFEAP